MRRKGQIRQNNAGMTLIELMICLAIVAIIALIVNRYMFSSSKLYGSGNNEVNLQIELQTVADHIGDELLECQSVTSFREGSTTRYLLRKSQGKALLVIFNEEDNTLSQRSITVQDSELTGGGTLEEKYTNKLLEYAKEAYDSSGVMELSKIVVSFSIEPVLESSGKLYAVNLKMSSQGKEKSCSKQVKLRNS